MEAASCSEISVNNHQETPHRITEDSGLITRPWEAQI